MSALAQARHRDQQELVAMVEGQPKQGGYRTG